MAASRTLRLALLLGPLLLGPPAHPRPWTPDDGSRLDRAAVAAILAEFSGDQRRALSEYRSLLREDPSLVFAADALRDLALEAGSIEALRVLGPWTVIHRPADEEILGPWLEDLLASSDHDTLLEALDRLPQGAWPDLRLRLGIAEGELESAWQQLPALLAQQEWRALSDEEWLALLVWRQRSNRALEDPVRRAALDWLSDTDRRGRRDLFDQALATLPPEEGEHLRLRQDLLAGQVDRAWQRLGDLLSRKTVEPEVYDGLLLWVRLAGRQSPGDSTAARTRVEQALELLSHSRPRTADPAARLAEARLHWLLDRPGPALDAISACLELDSLQVDALVLRGHIQLERQLWEEAGQAFERALELFPAHPEILDPYCYALQRAGRGEQALPLRARLVEHFPGQQSFWIDYGNLLLDLGHREQALELGLAAVEAFGDTARPMLLNNTAYLMAQLGRDPKRALELARRALAAEPESPFYLDTLGWILLEQGDVAEAAPLLERALALRPGDPEILVHLGQLHAARGEIGQARTLWLRALEQAPGHPEASRLLGEPGAK